MMEIRDDLLSKAKESSAPAKPPVLSRRRPSDPWGDFETEEELTARLAAREETLHNSTIKKQDDHEDNIREGLNVILSDSILKSARPPEGTVIAAEPGAKLDAILPVIEKAKAKTSNKPVSNVVIAIGINDISEARSSGTANARYISAVNKVKNSFPEAKVHISAVIPRRETNQSIKLSNEHIAEVNNYLRAYCDGEEIKFIGNSSLFSKSIYENYHEKKDSSGIHLNKVGQDKLMDIITTALNRCDQRAKRSRSMISTPGSAEKDPKSRKHNS